MRMEIAKVPMLGSCVEIAGRVRGLNPLCGDFFKALPFAPIDATCASNLQTTSFDSLNHKLSGALSFMTQLGHIRELERLKVGLRSVLKHFS